MHTIGYAGAALLYLAASALYVVRFVRARPGTPALAAGLATCGTLLHAAGVALFWNHFGEPPLVGVGPSLASLSLLISLGLVGLEIFSHARPVGLILAPAAAALLLVAFLVGIRPAPAEAMVFRGPWLVFHVSLSFMGYAGWVVAAASGSMYLLQFREIKHKQLGAIFQFFPALEVLDHLSERALVVGFAALTVGIMVGWAWTLRFEPGLGLTEAKVLWGLFSWVVLGLLVWARLSGRRTDRQAAVWNVAGFAMVCVAYVVLKMIAPGTPFFL